MLWRGGKLGISAVLGLMLVSEMTLGARAVRAAESDDGAIGGTPTRLSYADGEVSYFRPGAQDWAPAQVNTALAPGDELYTGNRGNLELQVGARAFVRAWGDSQLGLVNHEPDFLQIKVTAGHVALDLRNVDPGRTVEIDTPQAAFTIERPGYYRVDVTQTGSSFVTRRSGQATMTPAGGQAVAIASSEEVVLEGLETPAVRSYVAPELDVWDRWNYARTEDLIDTISSRYVSAGVYGVDDLDHYGDWRVVPTYGSVWVPQSVPAGWAPYSSGRWIMDPCYGWTWVDTAPWGWAPYHYGRWVFVSGYWAWAPGPVVVRPVYAPALVAFFGGPSVHVAIGVPGVSWVALSWGEPLVPWWGRPHFVGPRAGNGVGAPPPRIVPAPKSASTVARPTFGNSQVERQRPPQPRQFGAPEPPEATRGARDNDGQRPGASPQRPDGNAQRRDGNNTQRPDVNAQRPENNAQRPGSAQRPDTNVPRPDTNAQRPDSNAQRPDTNAPRPGNAPRPDGSTRRPDNSSARPDGNTQRPDGNAQRPGPGAAGPREDGRGQRPPPQAQQQAPHPPQRVEGRGPQQQHRPPG